MSQERAILWTLSLNNRLLGVDFGLVPNGVKEGKYLFRYISSKVAPPQFPRKPSGLEFKPLQNSFPTFRYPLTLLNPWNPFEEECQTEKLSPLLLLLNSLLSPPQSNFYPLFLSS
jgi:hypothetical protein